MKKTTVGRIVNGKYINCDDNPPPESRMTETLKSRKFPPIRTDSTFLANHGTLSKQFENDDRQLNKVVEEARKRGYNPSPNDTYIPTLARYTGDPLAFVPAGNPRNHIKKVCEQTDRACEGAVEVERTKKPMKETVPLAEDLIQEEAAIRINNDPSEGLKPDDQLRNEIIQDHGAV